MPGPGSSYQRALGALRGARAVRAGWVALYLLVSYLVLLPVLTTPLVADDFVNPFSQVDDSGAGLGQGLAFGWRGATEGASFRLLGTTSGAFFNWLWLAISATFDVPMIAIYAVLKFVVLIGCGLAAGTLARSVLHIAGREVSRGLAWWISSMILFCTVQIHAYWSNDPVASYPLSGFAPAALGCLVLAAVLLLVREPTIRHAALATAMSTGAVLYYEINVGTVMGAGLVLATAMLRAPHHATARARLLWLSVPVVAVPAAFVLFGRFLTGDTAATYGGTTVRLGSPALRTFGLHLLSSLPGSAWTLSIRTLGGALAMSLFAMLVTCLLAVLVWVARHLLRAGSSGRPGNGTETADDRWVPDRWIAASAAVALLCSWLFAIGLQSITVKVQDETVGLGYVYTSYASGATAVAVLLSLAVPWIICHRVLLVRAGAGIVVTAFVLTQLTVNWRLSEQLNAGVVPNRRLIEAFDRDTPPPLRCQALGDWTAGPWPEYYERSMIDGLDKAYRHYFGEPFCENFKPQL